MECIELRCSRVIRKFRVGSLGVGLGGGGGCSDSRQVCMHESWHSLCCWRLMRAVAGYQHFVHGVTNLLMAWPILHTLLPYFQFMCLIADCVQYTDTCHSLRHLAKRVSLVRSYRISWQSPLLVLRQFFSTVRNYRVSHKRLFLPFLLFNIFIYELCKAVRYSGYFL